MYIPTQRFDIVVQAFQLMQHGKYIAIRLNTFSWKKSCNSNDAIVYMYYRALSPLLFYSIFSLNDKQSYSLD